MEELAQMAFEDMEIGSVNSQTKYSCEVSVLTEDEQMKDFDDKI